MRIFHIATTFLRLSSSNGRRTDPSVVSRLQQTGMPAMTELAGLYNEEHQDVKITYHADSSGTLLTQIEEGGECDLVFSAAQKQMNQLEADGLVEEGTRANVVNNQVTVVTRKGSGTQVNLGVLDEAEDVSDITAQEVSDALGGVEISEQDNVSKVLAAVAEGSCEVGTIYYSDLYGYENELNILETVSYDLTGSVLYPIARVKNAEADERQREAAGDFLEFILSDQAKAVFESYYFDTE